jgi:hypothetical protein
MEPTMKRIVAVMLASFGLLAGTSTAGWADRVDRNGFIRATGRIDPHARYSNDIAYEFGTVSKRGRKTVPYVERCYWTAKPGSILFTGLKQVCTRYTLENTE